MKNIMSNKNAADMIILHTHTHVDILNNRKKSQGVTASKNKYKKIIPIVK